MPAASYAFVLNGQVGLMSSRQMLTFGGKYFNVTNPTSGTAIAYGLQTGFSATANGLFGIQNTNPGGGANIYLDQLVRRSQLDGTDGHAGDEGRSVQRNRHRHHDGCRREPHPGEHQRGLRQHHRRLGAELRRRCRHGPSGGRDAEIAGPLVDPDRRGRQRG